MIWLSGNGKFGFVWYFLFCGGAASGHGGNTGPSGVGLGRGRQRINTHLHYRLESLRILVPADSFQALGPWKRLSLILSLEPNFMIFCAKSGGPPLKRCRSHLQGFRDFPADTTRRPRWLLRSERRAARRSSRGTRLSISISISYFGFMVY